MLIINKKIQDTEYAHILSLPSLFQNCCYIDIETTGFDRNRHMIYLIGILFYSQSKLYLRQYLCEKESDEYELLYRLNQDISQYKYLIHFNGQSFDLPYIKSRMALYNIKENISECISIDYYQALKPYKNFLRVDNLKLKTVESLLGYQRLDPFNGGDLIDLYHMYVQGNKKLEPALLLHNEEDMISLFYLNAFYPLFSLVYTKSASPHIHVENQEGLSPHVIICKSLPESKYYYNFSHQTPYGYVEAQSNKCVCGLPLYTKTLKHFYSDYKDYYYLPVEDYAIHKSVASFVHSSYKKKASKQTAYVKKKDTYVRCPLSEKEIRQVLPSDMSINFFHNDVNDAYTYIAFDEFKKLAHVLYDPIVTAILI